MTEQQAADEPVVVGRISGAFGVLGWVRVVSFTDPPENLLSYRPWLLGERSGWRSVRPAAHREHANGYVVQLRELADREGAQALAGTLIAVPRDALPALEDEYYWRDLVGLAVFDPAGVQVGTVDSMLATGAHDVVVIAPLPVEPVLAPGANEQGSTGRDPADQNRPGGEAASAGRARQILVPFLPRFVPVVDIAQGRMVIDWQDPA